MTPEEAEKELGLEMETRVVMAGAHVHQGKHGVYIGCRETLFGFRPVVRLESGEETFVMSLLDWKRDLS